MRRAFLLIIFTLSIALTTAKAQPVSHVRTFNVLDGLPTNSITSIKQAANGLIWIATWNGLCCYDGYRFTTFRGDPWGSDNALSSYRISAIEPDSRDNVWVRTYDGGLYLFDTHQCRYYNVGLAVQKKYGTASKPRNIYCLSNGHTWITDENHQLNLRIDDRYPLDIDRMEIWGTKGKAIKGSFIRKIETDRQGREWIVTDLGMMRYGSKEFRKNVFSNYPEGDTSHKGSPAEAYIQQNNIGKHCIDRQGNLWYTSPRGLLLVTFKNYHTRLLPLAEAEETRALLYRKDGTIWAGSKNGYIGIFNINNTGVQKTENIRWLTPQGTSSATKVRFSDYIYTMTEDRQGNVWIGTKGQGIYVIHANGRSISHYNHSDDPYSLSSNDVYDIHQDLQGNIWIATFGGGVNLLRGGDTEHIRFLHRNNELRSYPKGFEKVRRITHDQRGNIILSTATGLLTCTPSALVFHSTRHINNDTTSLRTNDVMQTLVTRSGKIFVATMGGGIQQIVSDNLQQDNLRLRTLAEMNLGTGNALSMTEDLQGDIWITREAEINRYNIKTNRLEQYGPNSMAEVAEMTEAQTIATPEGSIWAGTVGGILTFKTNAMQKSRFQPSIIFSSVLYQGEQEELPLLNCRQLDITDKRQRQFTVHFAALDYEDNYLMQYAYSMDGSEWTYIGHIPRITFSELSPGMHQLIVKSTNADGIWMDNETTLGIYVHPTLWERSWVRLLLLFLAVALCTWAVVRYLQHRQHSREREQRLENIMRQYRELQAQVGSLETKETDAPLPNSEAATEDFEGTGTATRHLYELSEPQIKDPDEEMMNQLMAYLEQHISDENLRIEDMAEAVGLGRSVFYSKMKELVGVSPSDFLKQLRMQRACQLVANSKLTFSEIAYAVGFTDPKYFSKCFKKETGKTPSAYRKL